MDECGPYQIEVQGPVDEKDLNALSPIQLTRLRAAGEPGSPSASVRYGLCTDQSGLIGLLRHLHGRGIVLLSVYRER